MAGSVRQSTIARVRRGPPVRKATEGAVPWCTDRLSRAEQNPRSKRGFPAPSGKGSTAALRTGTARGLPRTAIQRSLGAEACSAGKASLGDGSTIRRTIEAIQLHPLLHRQTCSGAGGRSCALRDRRTGIGNVGRPLLPPGSISTHTSRVVPACDASPSGALRDPAVRGPGLASPARPSVAVEGRDTRSRAAGAWGADSRQHTARSNARSIPRRVQVPTHTLLPLLGPARRWKQTTTGHLHTPDRRTDICTASDGPAVGARSAWRASSSGGSSVVGNPRSSVGSCVTAVGCVHSERFDWTRLDLASADVGPHRGRLIDSWLTD